MSVALTEKAALQVKQFIAKRGNGIGLRLGVKTSGCSGLAYILEVADAINADDKVFEHFGVKVIVDSKSLVYLLGTTLDFIQDQFNSGFVYNNPNAKNYCGCGESFSV